MLNTSTTQDKVNKFPPDKIRKRFPTFDMRSKPEFKNTYSGLALITILYFQTMKKQSGNNDYAQLYYSEEFLACIMA